MPVDEAESRSSPPARRETPAAHKILTRLVDVGLGYLTPRPAAPDAVRRRAAAAQAGHPPRPRRAASTSSTNRPPASTSPTSSSCSACSTGSWTPASRSSSSITTRRSWRTPTGSSISAPAPATTAAGSSSRAHPPTSSPPAPPSPASTSRPTSAPDRGLDDAQRHSYLFRLIRVASPITYIMSPCPRRVEIRALPLDPCSGLGRFLGRFSGRFLLRGNADAKLAFGRGRGRSAKGFLLSTDVPSPGALVGCGSTGRRTMTESDDRLPLRGGTQEGT